MTSFADAASSYIADQSDTATRQVSWAAFCEMGLPTTTDEVWRYAPLNDLDLDQYNVSTRPLSVTDSEFASQLCARAGLVIRVIDGHCLDSGQSLAGVSVSTSNETESLGGDSFFARYEVDTFALLNGALTPATTVITVDPGVVIERPILVLQITNGKSSFARTQIDVGRGSSVTVVEYFEGGHDALVVPLSEYRVADNAQLQLITYQRLAATAWHVARTTGFLQRDARLRQAVIGLGGHYNRSRNDAEFLGTGAENELRTTFLGSSDQVHDFRTHQFHVAARTQSTLLSKGAVADSSRSVYTGLIEIEKGAKRTNARQTNHNLLLSPLAHADSVPNLEIRENDVMCAHASSVGPLDEMQRWYLESRGVRREDAERLMIQGFFNEMLTALPSDFAELVEADITTVLASLNVVAP